MLSLLQGGPKTKMHYGLANFLGLYKMNTILFIELWYKISCFRGVINETSSENVAIKKVIWNKSMKLFF